MTILRFGEWPSPVTASIASEGSKALSEILIRRGTTYFLESRPSEGGRNVVMRADPWSSATDVIPAGFNARSKVHGYGGGSYWVDGDSVFFSNFSDHRIYRRDGQSEPVPVTADTGGRHRYADGRVWGGFVFCVRERHEGSGAVLNELVRFPVNGEIEPEVIVGGNDFFSDPRISPKGDRICWLTWDLPNMPWDGTELWVGDLSAEGTVSNPRRLAGGKTESLFQPEWGPGGDLFVISDRTGWWNLYRVLPDSSLEPLAPRDSEFGVPQWVFGLSTYSFLSDGRMICSYEDAGSQRLATLDVNSKELMPLDLPYGCYASSICAEGDQVAFIAGGPATPMEAVLLDFSSRAVEVLHGSIEFPLEPAYISEPREIEFATTTGTAFAWFYPPRNPDAEGPIDEKPPLLVFTHGGPTSESSAAFDIRKQFWTTRGFALVDVNYGGSAGHGRAYRERLKGGWGVVDVEDCIAAVTHLVREGLVDPERVAIRGGSAGGFTTLAAMTSGTEVFAAGVSLYGVADLVAFATGGTHKFESRYLETLVGPWPSARHVYEERSPINHTDRLSRPMLVLQGEEDEVVPPAQSEMVVKALRAKGLTHAYLLFEGEQHGFRWKENQVASLEAELSFYGQIFGFEPPGILRLELVADTAGAGS